jgi:hypothetical protein
MSKAFTPVTLIRLGCAALCALAVTPASAQRLDGFIKSFRDNKDYIQPFATLFGSMTNSGWYQSAGVGRGFGFYFGLPINITAIADADREYKGTFNDPGCATAHHKNPGGSDCQESINFTAPTAFGRKRAPTFYKHNPDPNGIIVDTIPDERSDGLADIADLNWLPFGEPQLSVNFFHTELKIRYLALPLPKFSLSMPAVGLQHDISSFVPIPVPGLHVSLAGNMTWISAEFEPGDKITGKLELSGFSHFLGVLVGYTFLGRAEVFLETGWEGSHLETGGTLVITDSSPPETVKPNLSVDGRNGFRAALNVAVHFGYQAVAGQNVGSELGNNISVLGYRF